jgi:preprotein translocase subunit SecD
MYRSVILTACAIVMLFGGAVQARAQLTMHAAADDPVAGWQRMDVEGRVVWVNPTPALTSADIQGAEPATDRNFGNFVKVIFTDAGATKMRELTTAQMDKPIAIVLDGKLMSAPKVRSVITRDGIITGKAPEGLSTEQVRRILTSVNQKLK